MHSAPSQRLSPRRSPGISDLRNEGALDCSTVIGCWACKPRSVAACRLASRQKIARSHPPWPPACLPSVVEHGARRKQRAQRHGTVGGAVEGNSGRHPTPRPGGLCARRLCTMCCPGVRSPSVGSATTLTSPFSLQKILGQDGLTTSGRLHAHHSHQMYFALHARMATNRWVAPVEHHQLCFVAQNGSHRDWSLENIHLRDLALSRPSSDLRNPYTLEA